jgi:hypothetical protein
MASDSWLFVVSGSGRDLVSGERRRVVMTMMRLVVTFILR